MSDLYTDWAEERVNKEAVLKLIYNHRDEYDELSGKVAEQQIDELKRLVHLHMKSIEEIRALNPNGTNVGALEITANSLAAENTYLHRELRKRDQRIKRLEEKLKKFTDAVRGAR